MASTSMKVNLKDWAIISWILFMPISSHYICIMASIPSTSAIIGCLQRDFPSRFTTEMKARVSGFMQFLIAGRILNRYMND